MCVAARRTLLSGAVKNMNQPAATAPYEVKLNLGALGPRPPEGGPESGAEHFIYKHCEQNHRRPSISAPGASKQRSDSCMMRSMHRLMTVSRVIAILTRHCPAAMSPFSSFTMAVPMASPMFMSEKTRDSSPL